MSYRLSSLPILRPAITTGHGYPPRCTRQRPQAFHVRGQYPLLARPFTSGPNLAAEHQPSHYDILGVLPTATHADLKKRFYVLSKDHHPDLHPNDPVAVQKFQQISESYSVLGNTQKRKKYDRDVMRVHHARHHQRSGHGTYAGSRAPTGLSKRRSTFRGPPPSYFAHGTGGRSRSQQQEHQQAQSSTASSSEYTWHPGAADYGAANDAFNARPIFQTQQAEDSRRDARRAAAMAAAQAEAEMDSDFWARFVVVCAIVMGGVFLGGLIVNMSDKPTRGNAGGMVRGDGSPRSPSSKAADGTSRKEPG